MLSEIDELLQQWSQKIMQRAQKPETFLLATQKIRYKSLLDLKKAKTTSHNKFSNLSCHNIRIEHTHLLKKFI
jgi:hypothetical protein